MPPLFSAFVGHLAKETTKQELTELFSRCGEVRDVYIHAENEQPYCYAFVRFSDVKGLLKAVVELNRWPFHGKEIKVDIASECREVVSKAAKSRKPSRSAVIRDGSVRAQIKEACVELNENLDFTSGRITSLDSKFVLDRVATQRSGPTRKLTGMPSAECLSTLERMRTKLMTGEYNHAIPHKPHPKASSFFHALRALADDVNQFLEQHEELTSSADAKMGKRGTSQKLQGHILMESPRKFHEDFQQARAALQQKETAFDKVTPCAHASTGAVNSVRDCTVNSTGSCVHKGGKIDASNDPCHSERMRARAELLDDGAMYGIDVYRHSSGGTMLAYEGQQILREHSHFMTSPLLSSNPDRTPAVFSHPNMSPALYPPNRSVLSPSSRSTAGLLPDPSNLSSVLGPIPAMHGAYRHYDYSPPVRPPWEKQNIGLQHFPPGTYPPHAPPSVNSSRSVPYNGPLTTPKFTSDRSSAETQEDGLSAKTSFQHSDSGETLARRVISRDNNAGDDAFSDANEETNGADSSIVIPDKLRHLFEQQSDGVNSKECLSMLRELGRQNSNMLFARPDGQLEESCEHVSSDSGAESFEDPVQNPCDPRYSVSGKSLRAPQMSFIVTQRSHKDPDLEAVSRTVGDVGDGSQNGGPSSKKPNTQAMGVIRGCSVQDNPSSKGLNMHAMGGVLRGNKFSTAGLGRGRSLTMLLSRSNSHQ